MKPYRKIKCAGHTFKMYYPCNSINKEDLAGEINYTYHTIKITDRVQIYKGKKIIKELKRIKQEIEESIMHEITHQVNTYYNNGMLKEAQVKRLSQGFYQVLKDNFNLKLLKR